MSAYYILLGYTGIVDLGVDLGQRVDHTAFVVIEQQVVVTARRDMTTYENLRERNLFVRMVERVRLGTGFRAVVEEELRGMRKVQTVKGPRFEIA